MKQSWYQDKHDEALAKVKQEATKKQASAICETVGSRRMSVGPIHNEQQETMFDTELSASVDDLVMVTRSIKRAKEVEASCKDDLIRVMKKNQIKSLHFDGGTITIQESEEKIKVKLDEGFEPQEA